MKPQLNDLLQKRMDRKDFIKHVAVGLVAMTGVTAAIKAMYTPPQGRPQAYGASAYGGARRNTSR
ncbi:MAG: hypothetical protein ACREGJ_05080 [Candidatus Saccharimonadales bacterium]